MGVFWINLYWSVMIIAFGACVGSFLNVVIFRWPRDISLRRPLRSFCPSCRSTLHWRDNVPVVSYVFLQARCRYCRAPIGLQYPLIELATAFAFLVVFDAFFVAKLREGITDIASDWPMLFAHWVLAAGLIVLTVMDLEAYLVDIRVTWAMVVVGFALHAIWAAGTQAATADWLRPGPYLATLSLAAAVGLWIGAAIWLRRGPAEPDAPELPAPEPSGPAPASGSTPQDASTPTGVAAASDEAAPDAQDALAPQRTPGYVWIWALLGVLILVAYVGSMVLQDYQSWTRLTEPTRDADGRLVWQAPPAVDPGVVRIGVGLGLLFVLLTLFASLPHPEEDEGIVEAIEAEAAGARRQALRELALLSPAIVLMLAAIWALLANPALVERVELILHWRPVGTWQPLVGLATALAGWVVGGGLAWGTRVAGTLGLGKEAFGMGDVHIMAAIGALAGAAVAFIGFFAASLLALVGMVVILFRRQGRALPYGPWLALAAFIVAVYLDKILAYLKMAEPLQ